MWYPFKNWKSNRERRKQFEKEFNGKYWLCYSPPTAEKPIPRITCYQLSIPLCGCGNSFPDICMEILGKLLQPFQVIAYLNGWDYWGEQPEQGVEAYGWPLLERNPAYRHKLLTPETKEHEGLLSAEGTLISLARQLERPLPTVKNSQPGGGGMYDYFRLYATRGLSSSVYDLDGLQYPMDQNPWDIYVEFQASPALLIVAVKMEQPEQPDIDAVISVFQQVCSTHAQGLVIETY